MSRIRLSTTVDSELLKNARELGIGPTDSSVIEAALRSLLAHHEAAQIDASYAAYDERPVDAPDAWGDLGSWRASAGAS